MNVPFNTLKCIALLCKVMFLWFAQDLFSSSKTVKSKATSLPTSKSLTKAPLSLFDDDEEVNTPSRRLLYMGTLLHSLLQMQQEISRSLQHQASK